MSEMRIVSLEFNGKERDFHEWKRKVCYEYKYVNTIEEVQYCFKDEWHIAVRLECEPYRPDEITEHLMYGDSQYEGYLMSEEYEEDCRQEKWDWLKDA